MDFITRAGRVLSASIIISSFYCSVARAYTINRFSSAIGVTLDAGELSAQLSPAAPGGKDTFISSLGGNSNFGNATDLFVQTAPNSGLIVTQRSYPVRFECNAI